MKPSAFEYFAPAGIEAAVGLLEQYGEEARPLAGAGPVPRRAREAEGILQGHPTTGEQIAQAARKASEEVRPESAVHASADYRREMVAVVVHRALRTVLGRVQ